MLKSLWGTGGDPDSLGRTWRPDAQGLCSLPFAISNPEGAARSTSVKAGTGFLVLRMAGGEIMPVARVLCSQQTLLLLSIQPSSPHPSASIALHLEWALF